MMPHRLAYPSVDQRAQPLTDLELTILRQLAEGAHDPEIAKALDVSDRTYRRYVTAMQRKLDARSRARRRARPPCGPAHPAPHRTTPRKDST